AQDIVHDHLYADVLKIRTDGHVASVIAERQIERHDRRFQSGPPLDRAREAPAPDSTAECRTLTIDVRWHGLVGEVMGDIVHEPGRTPRTVAPTETATIDQSRLRLDTVLSNSRCSLSERREAP